MADHSVIVPPLIGGQAEAWAALVELAPAFGDNWLLVGGQMVFLHEVERQATDARPMTSTWLSTCEPSQQVSPESTRR